MPFSLICSPRRGLPRRGTCGGVTQAGTGGPYVSSRSHLAGRGLALTPGVPVGLRLCPLISCRCRPQAESASGVRPAGIRRDTSAASDRATGDNQVAYIHRRTAVRARAGKPGRNGLTGEAVDRENAGIVGSRVITSRVAMTARQTIGQAGVLGADKSTLRTGRRDLSDDPRCAQRYGDGHGDRRGGAAGHEPDDTRGQGAVPVGRRGV
jgi:hypothetical protein